MRRGENRFVLHDEGALGGNSPGSYTPLIREAEGPVDLGPGTGGTVRR